MLRSQAFKGRARAGRVRVLGLEFKFLSKNQNTSNKLQTGLLTS